MIMIVKAVDRRKIYIVQASDDNKARSVTTPSPLSKGREVESSSLRQSVGGCAREYKGRAC